jgi:hypothetical protein
MPVSWEATFARKMAFFYKHRGLLELSRADRVAAVKREIAELENAQESERASHKANCGRCQSGEFCFASLELSPQYSDINERLRLLAAEESDAKYAEKARQGHPEHHCDGWCFKCPEN